MKKILILTDCFPPNGGPRMGYLADFLKRNGWDLYVVTIDKIVGAESQIKPLIDSEKIFRINVDHYSTLSLRRFKDYIFYPEKTHEGNLKDCFIDSVLNQLKETNFSFIIASTAFFYSVLSAADHLSKLLGVPWCADLRDIIEQSPSNNKSLRKQIRDKVIINRRNSLIKSASFITTISKWHVKFLLKKFSSRVHLIYNGYDPSLFPVLMPPIRSEIFKIVYTGNLWKSRDLTLIFKSLDDLIFEKVIEIKNVSVEIYGNNSEMTKEYSTFKSGISIKKFDMIDHNKIPEFLRYASILIVIVGQNTKGIMTTKAFEYIASRRPVLSIPKADGTLTEIIIQTQSGNSCDREEEVSQMILGLYNQWKEHGAVNNMPENSNVYKYSREYQSSKFNDLIINNI